MALQGTEMIPGPGSLLAAAGTPVPDGSTTATYQPSAWRIWAARLPVILCAVWVLLVVAGALFASWLPIPDPAAAAPVDRLQGPSSEHWLGTDNLGRDTFSRIVYGGRVSLVVGVGSVILGAAVGLAIGIVAGFFRGVADVFLSWFIDVVMSFPSLVLLIAVVSFAGGGARNITLTMALLMVPVFARLGRVHTMSVSSEEFVLAARASGASRLRILVREVVPTVLPAVSGYFLISLGIAIVTEGGLSFLGLSVSEPTPSWGGLIASGQTFINESMIGILAPSLVLCLTVLSLNVLGERIRRRVETGE